MIKITTNKDTVNREGFWFSNQEPDLPVPASVPWSKRAGFLRLLARVEAKADSVSCRGFSVCRICDNANGSEEFSITVNGNKWVWPSGYYHYIDKHQVRPSLAFEEFITFVANWPSK